MSQWVRGGLTFLGAGSVPPTSLAAEPTQAIDRKQDRDGKGPALAHQSSNTPGIEAGPRSSQPGTGNPLSRRKSGFQSFDW